MKKLIYLSKATEEGFGEIQDCGHNKTDIIQGPIAYLHDVYIFQWMIWKPPYQKGFKYSKCMCYRVIRREWWPC